MVKAIIFDADGMVVIPIGGKFSEHLARDFGISTETTVEFFKNEFQKCLIGKADLKQELKKYLEEWGWQKSIDELLEYWFTSEKNVDERVISTIKELRKRGIKCYLATNQEKYRTTYFAKQMGFGKVFDAMFSSAHIGYKKPTAQFFENIIQELPDVKKEEILFWDDKEEHVRGAQQFGFQAELYRNFEDFQDMVMEL